MENLFSTSDLSLCVILCYFNYKIEAIDKNDNSKVQFYFKRNENLDELIEKFWRKDLLVEPITFFSLIKEVKNRIYIDK